MPVQDSVPAGGDPSMALVAVAERAKTGLVDLPVETVRMIFSECRQRDLCSLALVCGHFDGITRSILFRHPTIVVPSCIAWIEALESNPDLFDRARSLKIVVDLPDDDWISDDSDPFCFLADLGHRFTNLREVVVDLNPEFEFWDLVHDINYLPSLTKIILCGVTTSVDNLAKEPSPMKSVAELSLTGAVSEFPAGTLAKVCAVFPNVRTVALDLWMFELSLPDQSALKGMPSLQELRVQTYNWSDGAWRAFGSHLPKTIESFQVSYAEGLEDADPAVPFDLTSPVPGMTSFELPSVDSDLAIELSEAFDRNTFPALRRIILPYSIVASDLGLPDVVRDMLHLSLDQAGFTAMKSSSGPQTRTETWERGASSDPSTAAKCVSSLRRLLFA